MDSYKTPYDDKPYQRPKDNNRRYATAGIVLAGVLVGGSFLSAVNTNRNYGTGFSYGGQRYYVPGDSRRAVYPSREACMADVPFDRRDECEPKSTYFAGSAGRWYGPVYTPRDTYQPSGQYSSEKATSANIGNKLPKGSSSHGFGSNGKAFTGSKGS